MHILLVEDNAVLAVLFEVQLNQLGHQLTAAQTKAEAMAAFAKETFDLIFIDMGLDGRQDRGLEILSEMKAQVPEQRIGILSSNDLGDMVQQSQAGGAEFYMVKPFTMQGLSAVLSNDRTAIHNYRPEFGEGRIIPFRESFV
jgi:CheY-like chemotaxis protein